MLLKAFRNGAGYLIVFLNGAFPPKREVRTPEQQGRAEAAMEGHSLYQLRACPFCVKTRRAMGRLNLNIDIKDIGREKRYRKELETRGGRVKVPCLHIENGADETWIYESGDIIRYLEDRASKVM